MDLCYVARRVAAICLIGLRLTFSSSLQMEQKELVGDEDGLAEVSLKNQLNDQPHFATDVKVNGVFEKKPAFKQQVQEKKQLKQIIQLSANQKRDRRQIKVEDQLKKGERKVKQGSKNQKSQNQKQKQRVFQLICDLQAFGRIPSYPASSLVYNAEERNLLRRLVRAIDNAVLSPTQAVESVKVAHRRMGGDIPRWFRVRLLKQQAKDEKKVQVGGKSPRSFQIRRKDAECYGYTRGCRACSRLFQRLPVSTHSVECRARFSDLLKDATQFKMAAKRKVQFEEDKKRQLCLPWTITC